MPSRNRDILGPKNPGRDVGKEIDQQQPSPALKRAVARDLERHADDPIHASDEPVKPDQDEGGVEKKRPH